MQTTKSSSDTSSIRLIAVIVLYKMQLYNSPTLHTLLDAAAQTSKTDLELTILVHDNTPGGQEIGIIPEGISYQAAPENPGLAKAYNQALSLAKQGGQEWLLTLDQDTTLPANFLSQLAKYIRRFSKDPEVGAIVPQVLDGDRNLSPFRFVAGAFPQWYSRAHVGLSQVATYAVNSASTLRVSALATIGGYDPMFPLDISDINTFHHLHQRGFKVFIAGDLPIAHNFSLLNKHKRMTLSRYQALLWDECAFWDMNMGRLARLERLLRLGGRVCKDMLADGEADFRKMAIAEIRRRLSTSRPKRIAQWTSWATARINASESSTGTASV